MKPSDNEQFKTQFQKAESAQRESLRRRVLIVDDNEAIHSDFRKTLCHVRPEGELAGIKAALFGDDEGDAGEADAVVFEVDSAMQGQEGLAKVVAALKEDHPFNVAFVDMRMPPGWDGLQTIEQLWRVDPDLQVVICSAYSDHSWEEISKRLGKTDRLLILKKPFDPIEVSQLATALSEKWELKRRADLKMSQLEEIVQQRTQDLSRAALHDRLTDLPNRAMLHERLGRAIAAHQADAKKAYAVLFLDFDRFKLINDSLGHDAGDDLLVQIASRLTSCAEGNLVARLGGDEFVILLEGIENTSAAMGVAQKLLKALGESYVLQGRRVGSTASIGITTSDYRYARPEDAVRDADAAMYHAKAAGKARYACFDQRMYEEAKSRLELENDLRHGLEHEEFEVYYQPLMSLVTKEVDGFEALVRWNHPVRGTLAPGAFIGCAEETGMIRGLGEYVLRRACAQLKSWQEQYPQQSLVVSVNLSPCQLAAMDVVDTVKAAIVDTGVNPAGLALEITESVMIGGAEAAADLLHKIKALGVRLYMDDFGTGYSSLSCLHQFPLDALKIDRSFIQNVAERRDYAAVIHSIVNLARNLNMTLIAEGLETQEQVTMLQALECEKGQGYLFGRPMNVMAAEAFLREHCGRARAAA